MSVFNAIDLTAPILKTANNYGGGSGLPNGPTTRLESEQLSVWVAKNATRGAVPYTDQNMRKEFISGPAFVRDSGLKLNRENYRRIATAEINRLMSLGYSQAVNPENATLFYESYARTASENFSYLPIREEDAELLGEAASRYNFQYIAGGAATDFANGIGNVIKKSGDKLEDLGEVITNPLTLPAVAVIGVVAALFLLR